MKFPRGGKGGTSLAVGCCYLLQQPLLATSWTSASASQQRSFFGSKDDALSPATTTSSTQLNDAPLGKEAFTTWTFDKPCTTMEWTEMNAASLSAGEGEASMDSLEGVDLVMFGIQAPAKEGDSDDEDDEEEESSNDADEVPPDVSLTGLAKAADDALSGALTSLLQDNHKEFKLGAKMGGTTPTLRTPSSGRYIAVGLGAAPKANDDDKPIVVSFGDDAGSALGKAVATKLKSEKRVKTAAIVLPSALTSNTTFLTDFATAMYADLYVDNRFRTGPRVQKVTPDLETVTILCDQGSRGNGSATSAAESAAAIKAGKDVATGIYLTKDIVNAPHNVLNSISLANTAKRIAKESNGGAITCQILGKAECEKRGMGAFLGVARGSETEPQFIHLTYKSSKTTTPPNKKLGIVGKGLLFDTGGYNIKTGMMELMKFDCGGAAAVLGAARAIGALKPDDEHDNIEVHFVVAACENMISSKAYVPSDILTASNGKTIEVLNTDAEGRLTLADAICFCDLELNCDEIIELSTLTGACMIALGKNVAGLWTSNDDLASELAKSASATGDKVWRMPLESTYKDDLKSKFADVKNIGNRYGGAITAALFLQHFVSKKKPFAHVDIAGPVWNEKTGATGFGAKLVTNWVQQKGKTKKEDEK